MDTKKIWISALIFGLVATGIFYFSYFSKSANEEPIISEQMESENVTAEEPITVSAAEQSQEEQPQEEQPQEEQPNTMVPITKGKRAMSIQVNVVQGVSGFIQPESFVDVVAILEASEEFEYTADQHDSATLLLQNVKVLAIGHSADTTEEARRYETVTIEVTPKEGLLLGFAIRDQNQIYLTLRSEGDSTIEKESTHIHEEELHKGVFIP